MKSNISDDKDHFELTTFVILYIYKKGKRTWKLLTNCLVVIIRWSCVIELIFNCLLIGRRVLLVIPCHKGTSGDRAGSFMTQATMAFGTVRCFAKDSDNWPTARLGPTTLKPLITIKIKVLISFITNGHSIVIQSDIQRKSNWNLQTRPIFFL